MRRALSTGVIPVSREGAIGTLKDFVVRWRWALLGGAFGGALALGSILVVGRIGGAEGRILIEAVLPSVRFLSSGVLAAAATILALMLTALSVSRSADTRLDRRHYREMEQIGWLTTATLIASVLVLALASVPITETDAVDASLYRYLYMGTMAMVAFLTASFITVIVMLNISLRRLITAVAPSRPAEDGEPADQPGD